MHPVPSISAAGVLLLAAVACLVSGCVDEAGRAESVATAESCMKCHNGSLHNDYAGPGLENPHEFPGAEVLLCTGCHGGNPNGVDAATSHVPPPPSIGDRAQQANDPHAWFNMLTWAGIDTVPTTRLVALPTRASITCSSSILATCALPCSSGDVGSVTLRMRQA